MAKRIDPAILQKLLEDIKIVVESSGLPRSDILLVIDDAEGIAVLAPSRVDTEALLEAALFYVKSFDADQVVNVKPRKLNG